LQLRIKLLNVNEHNKLNSFLQELLTDHFE